jgi:hypothetical protein
MNLPENDHVIRYLRPSTFIDDQNYGKGFLRREKEAGVSVNHFEHFNDIEAIKSLKRIKYASTGILAKINIATTKAFVLLKAKITLEFIHDPLDAENGFAADPSHALIMNMPTENSPDAQLIAVLITRCVIRTYPSL